MRMFDTITNLRKASHSRRRIKQKATRTAWQRMAEHIPTMTIVYHNVLPGTLGGLSIFAVLRPHYTRIPPDVANAAAWLRTLFVSNTTNFLQPSKKSTKNPPHNVKYLTYVHKKIPASAGIMGRASCPNIKESSNGHCYPSNITPYCISVNKALTYAQLNRGATPSLVCLNI